jgi:hypothetical protein
MLEGILSFGHRRHAGRARLAAPLAQEFLDQLTCLRAESTSMISFPASRSISARVSGQTMTCSMNAANPYRIVAVPGPA